MECRYCGTYHKNGSMYCSNYPKVKNRRKRNRLLFILAALLFFSILAVSGFLLCIGNIDIHKQVKYGAFKEIKLVDKEIRKQDEMDDLKPTPKPVTEIKADTQKEVSQIITESLEKVVTIFTENNQGTGFIINNQGDILTNAHVVEGAVTITVLDHESQSYNGTVIGYSNVRDVAVIRIPELEWANHRALELDIQEYARIGEEVIALGSPLGNANTATLGTIAAVNRSFYIGDRIYENIYQMTAHISPGSSGGPLLSVETGKVIGINSARSMEDESIGFSIPLKDVYSLIRNWVNAPLTEKQLTDLFYKNNGDLHFEDEKKRIDEGYFEGGVTTEEPGVYYEIPEDWYEKNDGMEENREDEAGEDPIEES